MAGSKRRGKGPGGGHNPSARQKSQRVKSARGRKAGSTRWLQRQLNDPYVAEAKRLGYRSRSAFKLLELDRKYDLIRPGMRVVDLGAAPGGWTQVAVEKAGESHVVAVDILEMDPISGATIIRGDFLDAGTEAAVLGALDGPVDLVLSDMSPNTTGHAATDHLRIMGLVEAALDFAERVLAPGGAFVAKVFQGGTEAGLLDKVKRDFAKVRHAKPRASRPESAEQYLVATGYRGNAERSGTPPP